MPRWLVTGATGLLGSNVALRLGEESEIVLTARSAPRSAPATFLAADLASANSRSGLVDRAAADVIFHSAAISSIEACESNPALAQLVNVDASADLARQAYAVGSKFVFISTDAVFDGSIGNYSETDPASPSTEYGRSKVRAENAVLEANPDAIIARVNFYGWSPTGRRSLAEFFHRELAAGHTVNGFTDTVVSTMYVGDLVESIALLVAHRASGIFNVVSSEPISKYDFGRNIAKAFGFDPLLVREATSADHLADRRGSQMSLSVDKFWSTTGSRPVGQLDGIARLRAAFDSGVPEIIKQYAN
ncbi:dTDP-4-dehydrorhamnose reductase [Microterricola gilva]|uniref:dTDP-4-dehydrorhamnose reductase n=1 Tax=Microterricola gilva TaxID=393267 RepID=A0A4Q8AQL7_9MICO|nr:SDR family oxidoreductase [Microterricola gilva]RZU66511.1 dTDP-4-dehydrorhamnose reductase [Microterricola gilva]